MRSSLHALDEAPSRMAVLDLLESIGGEVADEELRHHLGPNGAVIAARLAAEGLVQIRSTFEVTPSGRKTLGAVA